jgi:exopolysaccharide biosynthesis WecB/TagA/CpsF family protein
MSVENLRPRRLATSPREQREKAEALRGRRLDDAPLRREPRSQGSRQRSPAAAPPAVPILGVRIDRLTGDQALEVIGQRSDAGVQQVLAYVNAHSLNLATRNRALREALSRSSLVMNDGSGVSLAAKMRGESFPENLNGSDFTIRLLALASSRGWGVFLLGGEPGVAAASAVRLVQQIEGLRVVGTCHGFTAESEDDLGRRVRDSGAKMVIVALGSPLQEIWLDRNLAGTGALVGVGVGAFLDFTAERVTRAPSWMNAMGIEWCFRLLQEPNRLWRRYVVGNPLFLLRAWRDRHRGIELAEAAFDSEQGERH